MNAPSRPRLKSITPTPDGPQAAAQPVDATAVGEPEGAARKGVLSALRSDPHRGDGRYPVAWLHIAAPHGATPTATSRCLCGWDHSAVGHGRVLALITAHTAHRDACPLRNPQEGRAAA
ncbi:hypothetical protein [Streptomyces sp. NPDC059894]|uniref:hypothetical protein n=1 Tax=unclassified Streptomyces TaxID=2593676 RepID=UPI00366568CD